MRETTVKITVRFSPEEAEQVKQIAEAKGITVSDLVRRSVLKIPIPERISPEKLVRRNEAIRQLAYEVNKVGVNLNQIAKYCHMHREVDAFVLEKIVSIEAKLKELLETAYRSLTE